MLKILGRKKQWFSEEKTMKADALHLTKLYDTLSKAYGIRG
jgi:hypothetical protein